MQLPILARKSTHYLLITGIVAVFAFVPVNRESNAMVVFDPTNFMANIEQYYTDVEKLKTAYDQLNTEYQQLQQLYVQVQALTSKAGWERYLSQYANRLPMNSDDLQRMLEAGYNPGDADSVDKYKAKYANRYRPLTQQQVARSPTDRNWVVYQDINGTTQAALAMADETYDKNIAEYKTFIQQNQGNIGATEDLKSSVDLNNSMLNMMMRMQVDQLTIANQLLRLSAQQGNQDLNAMAVNAEFAGLGNTTMARK